MSTRSLIGIKNSDGSINYIYCHHDGYLDWVGKKLVNHYNKIETVRQLLDLGDMSSIGNKPIPNPDRFRVFAASYDDMCVTSKDRGKSNADLKTTTSLDLYIKKGSDFSVDYLYIYLADENRWMYKYIYDDKSWRSVQEDITASTR